MGKVEDYLETILSKHTRKNYANGIKKFEQWYGGSIIELIGNPEATVAVEKFYVTMKQKYPQNTCRNVTNSAMRFLKYFGTDVKPRRSLGIYRTEKAIGDHELTVDEIQRMASVADLKAQVILEVLLLGLRIGDAIALKVGDLDKLEKQAPIELKLRAAKEGAVYETFISQEFKELLKLYLPTVDGEWLFQGKQKRSHAKDETLNAALRSLAKRAGVKLHGRLIWQCGRKLVTRTGAELGVSHWIIRRMVGKSIPKSDHSRSNDIDLREGFLKLRGVLKLKPNAVSRKLSDIEELVKVCAEAVAESLKPTIRDVLIQRMASKPSNTLGLVTMPDLETMSAKEVLELYIRLKRIERMKEKNKSAHVGSMLRKPELS